MNGLEVIADPDNLADDIPLSLVKGYHMTFYVDWLDLWRQDEAALMRKFGSWETVNEVYRGTKPEDLMRHFQEDLALAQRLKAPYLVFHVSDVSLEEGYTYRWLHTDREVLDGAIEFINLLLDGVEPTFDFLVENQWWPGFTFTDPEKTEYLLSHINYPRVGIMLDTGHLMNTNWKLKSQWDGVKYILSMIEKHGELSRIDHAHVRSANRKDDLGQNLGLRRIDFIFKGKGLFQSDAGDELLSFPDVEHACVNLSRDQNAPRREILAFEKNAALYGGDLFNIGVCIRNYALDALLRVRGQMTVFSVNHGVPVLKLDFH